MPAGDFVLQGQGLLSDEDGVGQLLEHRVYGYVEAAVVKDPVSQMEQMHLDTYFSLLGPDLCAICEDRLVGDARPEVDVYLPEGTPAAFAYRKVQTRSFPDYLAEKGFHILTFSREEANAGVSNIVLTGPRRLIGMDMEGSPYGRTLQEHGVQATPVAFTALSSGYGGPHCASQVLLRSE